MVMDHDFSGLFTIQLDLYTFTTTQILIEVEKSIN